MSSQILLKLRVESAPTYICPLQQNLAIIPGQSIAVDVSLHVAYSATVWHVQQLNKQLIKT